MNRRAFLRRMGAAVVGVGLLGSELRAREPELAVDSLTAIPCDLGTITAGTFGHMVFVAGNPEPVRWRGMSDAGRWEPMGRSPQQDLYDFQKKLNRNTGYGIPG